ncbi:hypothetical protein CR513_18828, partial [Mucuna pruriens]
MGSSRIRVGRLIISTIQTHPERTSRTNRLSSTDSTISETTIPTTTTENASSRKFTIFGGPDEAIISTKYERHYPRPQDANRTVSQYCEPFIVGRIQQPTLTNNPKSEREYECNYSKKWKSNTTASTAIVVEIS